MAENSVVQLRLHSAAAAQNLGSCPWCSATDASVSAALIVSMSVDAVSSAQLRLYTTRAPMRCVRSLSTRKRREIAQSTLLGSRSSLGRVRSYRIKLKRHSAHTPLTSSLFVRRIAIAMKSAIAFSRRSVWTHFSSHVRLHSARAA